MSGTPLEGAMRLVALTAAIAAGVDAGDAYLQTTPSWPRPQRHSPGTSQRRRRARRRRGR